MSLARNRLASKVAERAQHRVADPVSVALVECPEVVQVEQDRRERPSLFRREPIARSNQPLERGIQVASIGQTCQRVADGRLGDLRVQPGVRDRQGNLAGNDRRDLQVERRVRAGQVAADEGQGSQDVVLAEDRDGECRDGCLALDPADGRRVALAIEMFVDDHASFGDGQPGHALAVRHPDADESLVGSGHRRDPVIAGRLVPQGEDHDVARDDGRTPPRRCADRPRAGPASR